MYALKLFDKWPKSSLDIEDPSSGCAWMKFLRTPTRWSLVGKTVLWSSVGTWIEKTTALEMSIFWIKKTKIVIVGIRGWYQNGWKKAKYESPCGRNSCKKMWIFMNHSHHDHVCLGCTQRHCQTSKDIVDNYKSMFESRIFAGAKEKQPCSEKPDPNISSWSYDMESHAKEMHGKILRTGEQNNSTTTRSRNTMHWRPPIQRRRIEIRWRIVTCMLSKFSEMLIFGTCWTTWFSMVSEYVRKVCSQIVFTCLYLARICRPNILWSVKKFVRAITTWTDRRLARLIPYINLTSHYRQYCHVGNTAQHCRFLKIQSQPREESYVSSQV